ncbi:hypothetical protein L3Q82_017796, partial [Scortum barcoo]
KALMNGERALSRAKKDASQSGDKEVHSTARARLKSGIKLEEQMHQERLERDLNTNNTKNMWEAIQTITGPHCQMSWTPFMLTLSQLSSLLRLQKIHVRSQMPELSLYSFFNSFCDRLSWMVLLTYYSLYTMSHHCWSTTFPQNTSTTTVTAYVGPGKRMREERIMSHLIFVHPLYLHFLKEGLKKESYRAMLACGTPDAVDRYRQAKQAAARRTVLEAKTRVWEEFGEAMEEDSKRFWQTVRRLRRGKQYSANTVYSAGGELLTSTGDIVGRWKKYFEDLLNPTDLPSSEEAEAGDSEVDSSITQAESH